MPSIAAEQAGKALRMPPFLVGVVLVGFGTSLPELVSSVMAVYAGSSEIVIGNVIGSNITNILLILGLAGVIGGTFYVKTDLLKFDLPVLLVSAFVLSLMVQDQQFSTGEGIICLLMLGIYLVAMLRSERQDPEESTPTKATARTWVLLIASPLFIFLGAKYTVDSVIAIAEIVQIGVYVIAMSAVALGTSLPEIVVAITAARRGQSEIVVGNIMGSNIFNTLGVMGIPSLLGQLTIPERVVHFSVPVFLAATMIHVIITVVSSPASLSFILVLCRSLFLLQSSIAT